MRVTRSFTVVVAFLLVAIICSTARAAPKSSMFRVVDRFPIAPQSGVMMIRLERTQAASDASSRRRRQKSWPSAVAVTFADGQTATGQVGWVTFDPRRSVTPAQWTAPLLHRFVRPVRPDDGLRRTAVPDGETSGDAFLFVRVPDGVSSGTLSIDGDLIEPRWFDPNRSASGFGLPGPEARRLPIEVSPGRPDPHDPFAAWRWDLLAEVLGQRPPTLDRFGGPDELRRLVAEHTAAAWRIGLANLAEDHPGVASALLDALTAHVESTVGPVAAWTADPAELDRLLKWLLDPAMPRANAARNIVAWIDGRPSILLWPSSIDRRRTIIAVINRTSTAIEIQSEWRELDDKPQSHRIPRMSLIEIEVERPLPPPPAFRRPGEPAWDPAQQEDRRPLTLLVSGTTPLGFEEAITTPPPALDAQPPGPLLAPIRPALTLANVESRRATTPTADLQATVQIRRRQSRWELFVECNRPLNFAKDDTLTVGIRRGGMDPIDFTVRVPEVGNVRVSPGEESESETKRSTDAPGVDVRRSSTDTRWFARIVLPDSVTRSRGGGDLDTVQFAIRRTFTIDTYAGAVPDAGADSDANDRTLVVQTAPAAIAPWRKSESLGGWLTLRLDRWDD